MLHYRGSALAQAIGYFNNFATTLVYSVYAGVFKKTWKGEHIIITDIEYCLSVLHTVNSLLYMY